MSIPELFNKVAELYFCVRWLLSRIAVTLTPRLCASTRVFAIGADVKEYAWTRISLFAFPISRTTASVAAPRGEKKTSIEGAAAGPADTGAREELQERDSKMARRATRKRRWPGIDDNLQRMTRIGYQPDRK